MPQKGNDHNTSSGVMLAKILRYVQKLLTIIHWKRLKNTRTLSFAWHTNNQWYMNEIWVRMIDNDRGKLKRSEETLFQWHFVYHKSHVDWPKDGSESARWATGDRTPQPSHGPVILGPTKIQVCLFHCRIREPSYCTSSNRQIVLQCLISVFF